MNAQVEFVSGRIAFAGEMTVYAAPQLQQSLAAATLTEQGPQEIDLAQVTEIDTAGVQILLMLHRRLATAGRPTHIVAASAIVRDTLKLCGLSVLLVAETLS